MKYRIVSVIHANGQMQYKPQVIRDSSMGINGSEVSNLRLNKSDGIVHTARSMSAASWFGTRQEAMDIITLHVQQSKDKPQVVYAYEDINF